MKSISLAGLLYYARRLELIRRKRNPNPVRTSEIAEKEECERLLVEIERRARDLYVFGRLEVDRAFTAAQYDSPCHDGTCPDGGSLSLHGTTNFDPARLKGLARMLYERLVSDEYGFKVRIFNTSNGICDSFRFELSWMER